jgi:hypothetical protein
MNQETKIEKKQINFSLSYPTAKEFAHAAIELGMKRSEVLAALIDGFLKQLKEQNREAYHEPQSK